MALWAALRAEHKVISSATATTAPTPTTMKYILLLPTACQYTNGLVTRWVIGRLIFSTLHAQWRCSGDWVLNQDILRPRGWDSSFRCTPVLISSGVTKLRAIAIGLEIEGHELRYSHSVPVEIAIVPIGIPRPVLGSAK